MRGETIVVFSTLPDAETARKVGRSLVEEKLAACVNIIPQIESIYRWKGAIESANETLAVIKTTAEKYSLLEARIRELHSYETPEIISLQIGGGLPDYLNWIEQSVQ
jgi:periplasmic divalent cation tolerance protein